MTAATWRKSSYTGPENNCVEVALGPAGARVRDSKAPERTPHSYSAPAWHAFLRQLRQVHH